MVLPVQLRGVHTVDALEDAPAVALVDMTEDMEPRLGALKDLTSKPWAPDVLHALHLSVWALIEDHVRRSMRDEQVQALWDLRPSNLAIVWPVTEGPAMKLWRPR